MSNGACPTPGPNVSRNRARRQRYARAKAREAVLREREARIAAEADAERARELLSRYEGCQGTVEGTELAVARDEGRKLRRELESMSSRYRTMIESAQEQVASARGERDRVLAELAALRESIDPEGGVERELALRKEAEQAKSRADAAIRSCQAQLADLKDELKRARDDASGRADELAATRRECSERIAELERLLSESSARAERFEGRASLLQAELSAARKDAERAREGERSAAERAASAEERARALECEHMDPIEGSALRGENDVLRARVAELLGETQALTDEIRARRERVEGLELENSRLSQLTETMLPVPSGLAFGAPTTICSGTGFQQTVLKEIAYRADGMILARGSSGVEGAVGRWFKR